MKRIPKKKLQKMISNTIEIASLTSGIEYDVFKNDRKRSYSVLFLQIVIAETVKRLPRSFRSRYSEIPWSEIANLEKVLIVDKKNVDLDMVWKTSHDMIPKLKNSLERILES